MRHWQQQKLSDKNCWLSMSGGATIDILDSSSEEDDEADPDLPSRDECEARCQAFAEITGTDTALAMFYLQDRGWNLDRALNAYFTETDNSTSAQSAPRVTSQVFVGTAGRGQPVGAASINNLSSAAGTGVSHGKRKATDEVNGEKSTYLTLAPPLKQSTSERRIRVLSWNVDGLDPDNLQSRTEGMCSCLIQEAPEVIFLQEVVAKSLSIIRARCIDYHVFPGMGDGLLAMPGAYFTTMLLRKSCASMKSVNNADFSSSSMGRSLLECQCTVKGIPLTLLTSHLESMADHSEERKRQLKICFDRMLSSHKDQTVIFGGDLNLRDKELTGTSAMPRRVEDLWESTGKRPEARYTWDLTINDNKQLEKKWQPRCRFDRLFLRQADVARVRPVYFELVGIQRLASCRRFPSDHWGILAHLDIVSPT